MKDEKTMYPYIPDWEPTGAGCCETATIITENYYG